MYSFVLHCAELVTEDVTRRLLPSLECALTMTIQYVTITSLCNFLPISMPTFDLRLAYIACTLCPDKKWGLNQPELFNFV